MGHAGIGPGHELLRPTWSVILLAALATVAGAMWGIALAHGVSPLLLALIPVALGMAFVALVKPEWMAVLLVALLWGFVTDVAVKYHGVPSITKPLFLFLAVGLVIRRFTGQRTRLVYDSTTWWILAYLFIAMLGIGYARDADRASYFAIDLAKDFLLYLILINLISTARLFRAAVWLLLLMGALLGTLTVYQEVTQSYNSNFGGLAQMALDAQIAEEIESRPRASGSIGDPNYYGQQLLVLVPLGIWALLNSRRWGPRLLAGYALLAMISGIGLTFSRGTYLALGATLLFFAIHMGLKLKHYLLGLLLLIVIIASAPVEVKARFSTLENLLPGNEGLQSELSFRRRFVEMFMAVNVFADHPLLGVGGQNYPIYYNQYIREHGSAVPDEQRSAHSLYLEVAAEHGAAGLIAFLGILVLGWNRLSRARQHFRQLGDLPLVELATALQVGFAGYLFSAVWLHGAYPILLWLQVALAVALNTIASRQIREREEAGAQELEPLSVIS